MLGRNTFWLWLDMGALRIGGLLAGFFLIRYFGPHDFGLYSTAMAVGFLVKFGTAVLAAAGAIMVRMSMPAASEDLMVASPSSLPCP